MGKIENFDTFLDLIFGELVMFNLIKWSELANRVFFKGLRFQRDKKVLRQVRTSIFFIYETKKLIVRLFYAFTSVLSINLEY